jgi:hypothetical protein
LVPHFYLKDEGGEPTFVFMRFLLCALQNKENKKE